MKSKQMSTTFFCVLLAQLPSAFAQITQPQAPVIELLVDVPGAKNVNTQLPYLHNLVEPRCVHSGSKWQQLSGPSASSISNNGGSSVVSIDSAGTYEFQLNCCSADRKDSLLGHSSRVGFGAATTGGLNSTGYTVVSNTNDSGPGSLRDALQSTGPSWIIFDQSLDGQTIFLSQSIDTSRPNKTIDGRGVSVTISAQSGSKGWPIFAFRGGNVIIHGIEITGGNSDVAALMLREGTNYWVDHVTISNMGDDAISIGQGSKPSTSATDITISNYKVFNTPKGILTGGNGNYPTFPLTRVTIHSSDLAAGERNPRTQRGGQTHIFNSYLHSYIYVGMEAGRDGIIISENNVLSAINAKKPGNSQTGRYSSLNYFAHESHQPVGHIFTSGDLYLDNAISSGSINPSSPPKFSIPYNYSLLSADAVLQHVSDNAGSENTDHSTLQCVTYNQTVNVN